MAKLAYKVAYEGTRMRVPDFVNSITDFTKVEPPSFASVYAVVLTCKSSQYSEGAARRQAQQIASERFPLKDIGFAGKLIRLKNKFAYFAEYWSISHQQIALREYEKEQTRKRVMDIINNSFSEKAEQVALIEKNLKSFPDLMEEFRPYLAFLSPDQYQFHDSNPKSTLTFRVNENILADVQRYAVEKRFSFKLIELKNLWRYRSGFNGIPVKMAQFGADENKRLVAVKFKIAMWNEMTRDI